MIEEKQDNFNDKILKILLWKARINEEIQSILMMYFEPFIRTNGTR